MNGIENITNKILSDAKNQAQEILTQAQKGAGEITRRYQEEAEKEGNRLLENFRKSAANKETRLSSVAELEGRKQILGAKQELIGRAFNKALEELLSLPEEKYLALLCKLAADASQSFSEAIILSPKDKDKYGEKVAAGANELLVKSQKAQKGKAALTLAEESRNIAGGLLLKDGNIEINCTLETKISMLKEGLSMDIAKVLFN